MQLDQHVWRILVVAAVSTSATLAFTQPGPLLTARRALHSHSPLPCARTRCPATPAPLTRERPHAPLGLGQARMSEAKEASASIVINAPIAEIWGVWSNFELMPRWQPWISEVVVNKADLTSKWTLRKKVLGVPLTFSWTAVELPRVEHKLIQWEATSGLENKGRVEFTDVEDGVNVKMTISYKVPSILAFMFRGRKSRDEGGPINAAVKKILISNLKTLKHTIENTPEVFI